MKSQTLLTKEAVTEKLTAITSKALFNNVKLLINIRPELAQVRITAVANADLCKHLFPSFELKTDDLKKVYAELILNYE